MRDAHQMLTTFADDDGRDAAPANTDRPASSADLDALPTLPFDGTQLRTAVRARMSQQTSPPLVPTRDSLPPPMIMAEEPLPLEPLLEPLPLDLLPMEPLAPQPRPSRAQEPAPRLALSESLARRSQSRRALARRTSQPSMRAISRAALEEMAPVDAMSLAVGYRRPPTQSLTGGLQEVSHPARARNPALGHAPYRVDAVQRSSLSAPRAATSLDLHGPIVRLSDLPPMMQPAHASIEGAAERATQIERRTTLLMLTAIGALLVSLMALLR